MLRRFISFRHPILIRRAFSHRHSGGPKITSTFKKGTPEYQQFITQTATGFLDFAKEANKQAQNHARVAADEVGKQANVATDKAVDQAVDKMMHGLSRNLTKLDEMSELHDVSMTATADLGILKFEISVSNRKFDKIPWNESEFTLH